MRAATLVAGVLVGFAACAPARSGVVAQPSPAATPRAPAASNDAGKLSSSGAAKPSGVAVESAASDDCAESDAVPPPAGVAPTLRADRAVRESAGTRTTYSVHGYVARSLRVTRALGADLRVHCITIAWPPGDTSNTGRPSTVAESIDLGWLRAIGNTLARVPWSHVLTLRRVVIDNRPTEHGIAAYDRQSLLDARDGATIWLNEHLFRAPNHWAHGNYGMYYAYHTNVDGRAFDDQAADHALFSPVLLHELAHLVMYNLVNPPDDPISAPGCALTCADTSCEGLAAREREAGCISPYCKPFKFSGSTENWAEQYRFYYQSSTTRALLEHAPTSCSALLADDSDISGEPFLPAWKRGLPDIDRFHRSRWESCANEACKPY